MPVATSQPVNRFKSYESIFNLFYIFNIIYSQFVLTQSTGAGCGTCSRAYEHTFLTLLLLSKVENVISRVNT